MDEFDKIMRNLNQKYMRSPRSRIISNNIINNQQEQRQIENVLNFQQMQKARIIRFYIEALVYDIKKSYGKEVLNNIIVDITAGYKTQELTKIKFIHSFLYHTIEKWYKRNPLTIQQALQNIVNKFLYIGITRKDCDQINVRRALSKICKLIKFDNANKIENQRLFKRVYDEMKAEPTYFYPWIQYLKRNDLITIIDD